MQKYVAQIQVIMTGYVTTGSANAGDAFSCVNGVLRADVNSKATYAVENGNLTVNSGFQGTITATAIVSGNAATSTVEFRYDHNGLRTQKKVVENGVTTTYDYTLHGKLITHLTKKTGSATNAELHFFYDAQGKPSMVKFENKLYRYVHSLQGDIVGILDTNGTRVVEYKYDAWGKPVSVDGTLKTTLGALNPFRYRGYVWDEESELFYLRNRYYSPKVGRIVNADTQLGGHALFSANLYLYCLNNPTLYSDSDGCEPQIAPIPSRPEDWNEQFEWKYYFSSAGVYYYGEPNSYRAWQNSKGEWCMSDGMIAMVLR